MSGEQRVRYFVTNHQNQPVELHLETGVTVLGPRQEIEVQAEDLASPQLVVMRQQRLLTTHTSVETLPEVPPAGKPGKGKTKKAGGKSAVAPAQEAAKKP